MEREQVDEWSSLQRVAGSRLRARPKAVRWLSVRRFPSFGDATSYTLFEDVHGWHLLRLIWRKAADSRKLETPVERLRHPRPLQPTIEETHASYSGTAAEAVLASLSKLKVTPHVGPKAVMLDGEIHELEVQSTMTSFAVTWQGTAPKEWGNVDMSLAEVVSSFDAAMSEAA